MYLQFKRNCYFKKLLYKQKFLKYKFFIYRECTVICVINIKLTKKNKEMFTMNLR